MQKRSKARSVNSRADSFAREIFAFPTAFESSSEYTSETLSKTREEFPKLKIPINHKDKTYLKAQDYFETVQFAH